MSSTKFSNNPDCHYVRPGQPVTTACGGLTRYTAGLPCAKFRGNTVYFCLFDCKVRFDQDAGNSCLAEQNPPL